MNERRKTIFLDEYRYGCGELVEKKSVSNEQNNF